MTITEAPTQLPSVTDIVGPLPDCKRSRLAALSKRVSAQVGDLDAKVADNQTTKTALVVSLRAAIEADESTDGILNRAGQLADELEALTAARELLGEVAAQLNAEHIGTLRDPVYVAWLQRSAQIRREYRAIVAAVEDETDIDAVERAELLHHRITRLAARYGTTSGD